MGAVIWKKGQVVKPAERGKEGDGVTREVVRYMRSSGFARCGVVLEFDEVRRLAAGVTLLRGRSRLL